MYLFPAWNNNIIIIFLKPDVSEGNILWSMNIVKDWSENHKNKYIYRLRYREIPYKENSANSWHRYALKLVNDFGLYQG